MGITNGVDDLKSTINTNAKEIDSVKNSVEGLSKISNLTTQTIKNILDMCVAKFDRFEKTILALSIWLAITTGISIGLLIYIIVEK